MALTDAQVKQLKSQDKSFTIKDVKGLSLFIYPSGAKCWHFRYSWSKNMVRFTLGQYPDLSVSEARALCAQYQKLVKDNVDPRTVHFKNDQENNVSLDGISFEEFIPAWLAFKLKKVNAKISKEKKNRGRQGTAVQIERYMRLDILPVLGKLPLALISRTDVLAVQERIEKRNALSSSEKVRTWLNEIFRYAVATGKIPMNPAADLDVVAIPYRRNKHNPFLRMHEMPELMGALRRFKGNRQTELGIRLLLLTGVRTGELRFAEPSQFDLKNGIWRIPPEDVKQLQQELTTKNENVPDYIVPLSEHAKKIIKELLSYRVGDERYLLLNRMDSQKAISENTLNQGLHDMGFKNRLTGHGIRATISTALNELGYDKDWIEAQLSHSDKDKVRATYNHAEYVEQRREMMQDWANRLDGWEKESHPKGNKK